jgi:hypothetical protein
MKLNSVLNYVCHCVSYYKEINKQITIEHNNLYIIHFRNSPDDELAKFETFSYIDIM